MSKLILTRHGQSLWNAENRFTGWVDVDLSQKGISEAQKSGKLIKNLKSSKNSISDINNIKNQLKTLDSFFSSQKMNSLLKDFKSIDLRYENRIAIGYM